jgi:hypothetical protein
MSRTSNLGSYPSSYIRVLAGYKAGQDPAFSLDVRRYNLPILSHAPDSFRESRYRIGPLVRAAIFGHLRNIGVGPSKCGFYLDQISDGDVEEAVSRLWAGVEDRMVACLPTFDDRRVFAHTEAQVAAALANGALVVFDLTDTLNGILEKRRVHV